MNLVDGDAIPTDVFVDRLSMLLLVTQGVEDLSQDKVRETPDDFFRGNAEFPQLGDRAHRRPGASDNGGSVEDLLSAHNVGMPRRSGHGRSLLKSREGVSFACNSAPIPLWSGSVQAVIIPASIGST